MRPDPLMILPAVSGLLQVLNVKYVAAANARKGIAVSEMQA